MVENEVDISFKPLDCWLFFGVLLLFDFCYQIGDPHHLSMNLFVTLGMF